MKRSGIYSYIEPVPTHRAPVCRYPWCDQPADGGPVGTCTLHTAEQLALRQARTGRAGWDFTSPDRERARRRAQRARDRRKAAVISPKYNAEAG